MNNKFNLVDEPWIPVFGRGLVSLSEIFSNQKLSALGGNPIQKTAVLKLLLAIAQAAYTPKDEADWKQLGADGMAKKTLEYLEKKKDLFWLYGKKPFLQMPRIIELIKLRKEAELKKANTPKIIGSIDIPDLPSENNTILTQHQCEKSLTDAEKALFLVSLMNFALGGKRIEKNLPPLTEGYSDKTVSAKSGPSIGNYRGYLHSYLVSDRIIVTLWINLLTNEQIDEYFKVNKLGIAPWEQMPSGENCSVAQKLRGSYMGCLIGLSRFTVFVDDGIYYVEGIQYPSHKNGWREPTMTICMAEIKPKVIWVDVEKKPWRELTAILSFVNSRSIGGFDCQQIRWISDRAKALGKFKVWSGGLRVRSNAGDQSVKQDDDFVESEVQLYASFFDKDSTEFVFLSREMEKLEDLSKIVYAATKGFLKALKVNGKKQARYASNLFWQLCERKFQKLVNFCKERSVKDIKDVRREFAKFADKAYNNYCPKNTARQLDAWAANRPNLYEYLEYQEAL